MKKLLLAASLLTISFDAAATDYDAIAQKAAVSFVCFGVYGIDQDESDTFKQLGEQEYKKSQYSVSEMKEKIKEVSYAFYASTDIEQGVVCSQVLASDNAASD